MASDTTVGGSNLRASTGMFTHGLPVGEVLRVPSLADATLLAGASGLHRIVQRLNVMEVPDILPWVKPNELLLTTGYPLRKHPESLSGLVADLDCRGLAAMAIKVGRYLDELPARMLTEADRLGFPIIALPEHVAFDDILNQVLTDILNRTAATLARSEEVHRALVQIVLAGGGLAEITDELVRLLGGAVFILDENGRVAASSGRPEELAAARSGSCFNAAGCWVCSVAEPGVRRHRGLAGGHAAVPVVAATSSHGLIVAFSQADKLADVDVDTLERAATVAALVITRQLAVVAVEQMYQSDLLRDLLNARPGSSERAAVLGASFGWKLARRTVVLVAEPDGGAPAQESHRGQRAARDRLAAAWAGIVRSGDPGAAVAGFSSELVAVIGEPTGELARHARDLAAALTRESGGRVPFSLGASRVATGLADLPTAYAQAATAARVGRQISGSGSVAHFDGLGVFRLLSLVPDSHELRSFVLDTLGDLAGKNDPVMADLRQTLQVLLDTNLNVAQTARQLHFHYNTLRYRINKLERMLGPFTEDAMLRLDLTLALLVVQMRGL